MTLRRFVDSPQRCHPEAVCSGRADHGELRQPAATSRRQRAARRGRPAAPRRGPPLVPRAARRGPFVRGAGRTVGHHGVRHLVREPGVSPARRRARSSRPPPPSSRGPSRCSTRCSSCGSWSRSSRRTPTSSPIPGGERDLREAVLRYSREVAFSAAEVYARAAEVRGAWDARLEALVVDALVRGRRRRLAALPRLGARVGRARDRPWSWSGTATSAARRHAHRRAAPGDPARRRRRPRRHPRRPPGPRAGRRGRPAGRGRVAAPPVRPRPRGDRTHGPRARRRRALGAAPRSRAWPRPRPGPRRRAPCWPTTCSPSAS